jgi:hypothetical protein
MIYLRRKKNMTLSRPRKCSVNHHTTAIKMSLHIPAPEKIDFENPEDFDGIEFTAKPISWYSNRNALRVLVALYVQSSYCGQDKSALLYLHLPQNLTNVKFNLSRTHPDDTSRFKRMGDGTKSSATF